ncbi:MAG TPA: WXG100 family type VII secretion target [Longimicrobiales bacterium]|nr:WXG100 family type VII secretion target [Longimicrobiales bacterium]
MAEAFVDPDRLRLFSEVLVAYSGHTGDCMGRLQAQLQRLGASWRDQEYDRFAQEFRKTKAQLATLQEEIDKIVPILKSDAERADAIHRK